MDRAAFDGLRVIRREWECDTGCSDVCRTSAGEACIRLQIRDGACQREVLSGGAKSAVRLDGGTLEILLPYRDGAPFDKWLERKPSLGQRRDACLAIVAQCIEEKAAPTVIELSAKAENLRFTEHGAGLQLLPDWGAWRRTAAADTATVQAVAALCAELLTSGFSKVQEHLYPVAARSQRGLQFVRSIPYETLLLLIPDLEPFRGMADGFRKLAELSDIRPRRHRRHLFAGDIVVQPA